MLSHRKNAILLATTIMLSGLASPAARTHVPSSVVQATSIARIEHIVINGTERAEATGLEALVTRASSREVQSAKAGMRLYANDLVSTGDNVKLIIRCLNLPTENDSKAILHPNTQIRIVDNTSYFLILGRIWFGVKGAFNVRTFYWVLGARGTEFEVQVNRDASASLAVLESAVGMSSTDAGKLRSVEPFEVKALEEVTLASPMTRLTKATPLTEERVRSILESTNEALLASQPIDTARRAFPHFESRRERSRAFRSARFNALWGKEAAAFHVLGNVYGDWGEGAKALEAYNKELSLNPRAHDSFALLTDIGESFRLVGDLEKAETFVTKALSKNQSWAPALNALGNVYLGKAEVARRNNDLDSAKRLLLRATEIYESSFLAVASLRAVDLDQLVTFELSASGKRRFDPFVSRGSFAEGGQFGQVEDPVREDASSGARQQNSIDSQNQSRGVSKFNLGDAKTLLADIAVEEKDPENAVRLYAEAQRAYLEARKFYPEYTYLESALNRVRQALQESKSNNTPQPTPRAETASPGRGGKQLKVPLQSARSGNISLATASALAGVVSYLADIDLEPCEVLGVMLSRSARRDLDCCERANSRMCALTSDPYGPYDLNYAISKFGALYDVTAASSRLSSYEDLVANIESNLPMVVLDRRGRFAIVITGYSPPDRLIVLSPIRAEKTVVSYRDLAVGEPILIRFRPGERIPEANKGVLKFANEIAGMFLDKDFNGVADRLKTLPGILQGQWDTIVKPAGPLVRRSAPRIRTGTSGFEVSIRCHFERRIINLVLDFDSTGRPVGLRLIPENQDVF